MTTEDHAELPAPFRRMLEVSFPEGTPSHRPGRPWPKVTQADVARRPSRRNAGRAPTREEPSPC